MVNLGVHDALLVIAYIAMQRFGYSLVMRAGTGNFGNMEDFQDQANIDVMLVLERIFWYAGHDIDETAIRAACLIYLKHRPEVHQKLKRSAKNRPLSGKLVGAFNEYGYKPRPMSQNLRDLFEEFRYRCRTSTDVD
jgi:hypothetical protein